MKSKSLGIVLDSISLFCEEPNLLKGSALYKLLNTNLAKYRPNKFAAQEFSPTLAQMPTAFCKPLKAYSEPDLSIMALQNRLSQMVRYNFSDGTQIGAHEILRSPYQSLLTPDLLPQPRSSQHHFLRWPLLDGIKSEFLTQEVEDILEITQSLLDRVVSAHNKKLFDLYLQTPLHPERALRLSSIEFDPNQELTWRIELSEKPKLQAEFALIGIRKVPLHFFPSFALDTSFGALIAHSWHHEMKMLREELSGLSQAPHFYDGEMPKFEIHGEFEIKSLIKYLRKRPIGVKLEGMTKQLRPDQSRTEIHLDANGFFSIRHFAYHTGQKSIERVGFSAKGQALLQTLSQGIGYLLKVSLREIATREAFKREWDLKLLKHLGLLHYITFETLKYTFAPEHSDYAKIQSPDFFRYLHSGIKKLLLDRGAFSAFGHMALEELCSKPVVKIFENYVNSLLQNIQETESFYSEHGEIILEGLVEREYRLIFELLKNRVFSEGVEVFAKSKLTFAQSISEFEDWNETKFEDNRFLFSRDQNSSENSLAIALEVAHSLKLHNFVLFFQDQVVEELQDHQVQIDFALTGDNETRNLNWFELNPCVFLEGTQVAFEDLFSLKGHRLIEHQGKSYILPKSQLPLISYLEVFWLKLQRQEDSQTPAHIKRRTYRSYHVDRHQTLELLALRSKGVQMRGDHHWQELCTFYDQLGHNSCEIAVPQSLVARPKNYQLQGIQWLYDLYRLRLGALLADEMGLGKTLQALGFLLKLEQEQRLGKVLIIVPASLIFNWQNEIKKFAPTLPLSIFSPKEFERVAQKMESSEDALILTSYGLLVEHDQFLYQYQWNVVFFDEAQNLKNIDTKRTKAARKLRASFKAALTGTPMENSYAEFYSVMDLILPGCLGRYDDFRRQFVNTDLITKNEMNLLKETLKPVILRRTKQQIFLELPEKQETKISIAFDSDQRQIYRDIAISYNEQVKDVISSRQGDVQLKMLTALLRLRQACSDPSALPNVNYNKVSPKIKTLNSALQEVIASGESALVFTQFLQTMKSAQEILIESGLKVLTLHGGLSPIKRKAIIEEFENSQAPQILLMTMKTGGVGLNLTKASYVFHLEPWWNPAVENQATDRAHRIGQTKRVQVFRYVMHDSLEEKIEQLKDRKSKKFHALLGESSSATLENFATSTSSSLSKEDFDLLLGL